LRPFVLLDQGPQVVAQQRRQVRTGLADEGVELLLGGSAARPTSGTVGVTVVAEPRPPPVPAAGERTQIGLEAVVVTAGQLLPPRDVGHEAIDLAHGAVAVVAAVGDRRRGTHAGGRLPGLID